MIFWAFSGLCSPVPFLPEKLTSFSNQLPFLKIASGWLTECVNDTYISPICCKFLKNLSIPLLDALICTFILATCSLAVMFIESIQNIANAALVSEGSTKKIGRLCWNAMSFSELTKRQQSKFTESCIAAFYNNLELVKNYLLWSEVAIYMRKLSQLRGPRFSENVGYIMAINIPL